jgi:signal peptidase II
MVNGVQNGAGMTKHLAVYFGLSLLIVIVDLWTKSLATEHLEYAAPVPVYSLFDALTGFNLTLLHNTGAAFSFLASESGWQRWFFIALAFFVSLGLGIWLTKLRDDKWVALAVALILGGAIGNLYDRITLGYVVDFLHFYWGNYHFPAFNIADTAITIGASLMVLDLFRPKKNHDSEGAK